MGDHDLSPVCCLCGDIGFTAKLFLCTMCGWRYQHSYCSNYHGEGGTSGVCDWCQSEERGGNRTLCWAKLQGRKEAGTIGLSRHQNSSNKPNHKDNSERVKNASGASSSRPANRRYKLLKDSGGARNSSGWGPKSTGRHYQKYFHA